MNKTKKQHFVPQWYLRYFTHTEKRLNEKSSAFNKRCRIWCLDMDMNKKEEIKSPKIRDIAYENYLYSYLDSSGKLSFETEHDLGKHVEEPLSKIFEYIADNNICVDIPPDGKRLLSIFIVNLILRNPSFFDKWSEIQSLSRIETSDNELVSLKESWSKSILPLTDKLYPVFYKKKWQIFCSDKPTFATSSDPVKIKSGMIFFPLTPYRMLIMCDSEDETQVVKYFTATEEWCMFFNSLSLTLPPISNLLFFPTTNIRHPTELELNKFIELGMTISK